MGVTQWADILKTKVWLAGREIGTAGNLFSTPQTLPGTTAGVAADAGFVHQSGGASPKASSGAADYITGVLRFQPYLSQTDFEHIQALRITQRMTGFPSLWLPIPRVEAWTIRSTARTTWSLAGTISGSAGVRLLHVVPLVEIRDASGVVTSTTVPADHPGAATLTIVAGAPASSSEIQIPTGPDTTALTTGDLTGDAGSSLLIQYFGFIPVEIVSVSREIAELNNLVDEIELIDRPTLRDYETD